MSCNQKIHRRNALLLVLGESVCMFTRSRLTKWLFYIESLTFNRHITGRKLVCTRAERELGRGRAPDFMAKLCERVVAGLQYRCGQTSLSRQKRHQDVSNQVNVKRRSL